MTYNEVYAWLNRPTKLTYDIKAKIRIAEELRSCLLPSAIRYDKDKIVTSYGTNADPMTEIAARVEVVIKEIAELQLQRATAICELDDVFKTLDPRERDVMSRYYISRKSIATICRETNYHKRWVYEMRSRGVDHVKDFLNTTQKCTKNDLLC